MYNTSGALPASPGAPTTYGESASHKPGEGSSWGQRLHLLSVWELAQVALPGDSAPHRWAQPFSSLPGLCSPEAEVACFQWLRES